MEDQLTQLQQNYLAKIDQASSSDDLEALRITIFGSNGEFTKLSKDLPNVDKDDRPKIGKLLNDVKQALTDALAQRTSSLHRFNASSLVDLTLPGKRPNVGHLHPITQAIWDIGRIFERIGFEVTDTREIDTDWYAFGALNFPENHPARDEWETFFIDAPATDDNSKMVLTPHTSNAQTRVMKAQQPPIRNITISKTYRRQADTSHLTMFHQFEGIFIDKQVSIANLKGLLDYFFKQYFGNERTYRIRPYDFRFTEPSFELDINCANCGGSGKLSNGEKCRVCKQGWLELGGCGMIHQNVLSAGGIDPNEYSGCAFGWGVERVWMMRGGINMPDIRQIYTNDLRFNNQF